MTTQPGTCDACEKESVQFHYIWCEKCQGVSGSVKSPMNGILRCPLK